MSNYPCSVYSLQFVITRKVYIVTVVSNGLISNALNYLIVTLSPLTNNNEHWFCPSCLSNIFSFNALVNDFDFLTCLYNFSHCNKINLKFIKNSHQLYLTSKYKPCSSDIDPDKFYYNQLQSNASSSYYLDDKFNSMLMQNNI